MSTSDERIIELLREPLTQQPPPEPMLFPAEPWAFAQVIVQGVLWAFIGACATLGTLTLIAWACLQLWQLAS